MAMKKSKFNEVFWSRWKTWCEDNQELQAGLWEPAAKRPRPQEEEEEGPAPDSRLATLSDAEQHAILIVDQHIVPHFISRQWPQSMFTSDSVWSEYKEALLTPFGTSTTHSSALPTSLLLLGSLPNRCVLPPLTVIGCLTPSPAGAGQRLRTGRPQEDP